MTTMVCDGCGSPGIRWMGPWSALTHTECPHCGRRNCQRVAREEDGDDECADNPPPRVGTALACAASAKGGTQDER